MTAYRELLTKCNLLPRKEQESLFESIDETFKTANGVLLAQADTGVGKTLAVSASAVAFLQRNPNARYVIAVPTLALCREYIQALKPTGLNAEILLSCRNFFCHDRLDYQFKLVGGGELERVKLKPLYEWQGTIDEYVVEYGLLPLGLSESDVCQTTQGVSASFSEERERALKAQVLVTTHAMLAVDIVAFGNVLNLDLIKSSLVIDEADAFVDSLRDFQNQHFNILRETATLRASMNQSFNAYLNDEVSKLRAMLPKGLRRSELGRQLAIAVLERLHKNATRYLKKKLPQNENLLLGSFLQRVVSLIKLVKSTENVSLGLTNILGEPTIVVFNPYFCRVFGHYITKSNLPLVCVSGTLSVAHDIEEGTRWVEKELGLQALEVQKMEFSPEKFGSLKIQLYRTSVKMYELNVAEKKHLSGGWAKEVARHLQAMFGKVLVVTSSFDEAMMLGECLGEKALVHKAGDRISSLKSRFENSSERFLISPSAHTGLNFTGSNGRSFLSHVVITRLPFTPPNSMLKDLRGSPEFSDEKLQNLIYQDFKNNVDKVIRRGRQILGRGIRHENDAVQLVVMDNRFPAYAAVSSRHYRLSTIVPKRFLGEYRDAEVLLPLGQAVEADLSLLC